MTKVKRSVKKAVKKSAERKRKTKMVKKHPGGRPRTVHGDRSVTLRMPSKLFGKLSAFAKRDGLAVSEVARGMIAASLK